jgi:hypothetical protein
MSRSAYFICSDCKVRFWLGKPIIDINDKSNEKVKYYHIGQKSDLRNWERSDLNRVIWKMLADHEGHALQAVIDGGSLDTEYLFEDFIEIGGDEIGDISIADYLSEWDDL